MANVCGELLDKTLQRELGLASDADVEPRNISFDHCVQRRFDVCVQPI